MYVSPYKLPYSNPHFEQNYWDSCPGLGLRQLCHLWWIPYPSNGQWERIQKRTLLESCIQIRDQTSVLSPHHQHFSDILEKFHSFLKACITEHTHGKLDWKENIQLSLFSLRMLLGIHSKESPFFLLFGRDPLSAIRKPTFTHHLLPRRHKGLPDLESNEVCPCISKDKYHKWKTKIWCWWLYYRVSRWIQSQYTLQEIPYPLGIQNGNPTITYKFSTPYSTVLESTINGNPEMQTLEAYVSPML